MPQTYEQLASTLARKFTVDVEIPANSTAVTATATATGDLITTVAAHGLAVGTGVVFAGGATGGLVAGTTYYVISTPTATTFQVSSTLTGTALDITTNVTTGMTFTTVASWIKVRAMTGVLPKLDTDEEDDSDSDSGGWGSKAKTMQSWSLELSLLRKQGITSLAYDPGQETLRKAAELFGAAGIVKVRWYDRNGGPESYWGYGSPKWESDGSAVKDLDKAKCTITGNGARYAMANPAT